MNEQLQQLATQVGINLVMTEHTGCLEGQDYIVTDRNLTGEQLERFAELIIAECAKLQHKNVIVGGVSEYNRGRREMAEDILKHFGVQ